MLHAHVLRQLLGSRVTNLYRFHLPCLGGGVKKQLCMLGYLFD